MRQLPTRPAVSGRRLNLPLTAPSDDYEQRRHATRGEMPAAPSKSGRLYRQGAHACSGRQAGDCISAACVPALVTGASLSAPRGTSASSRGRTLRTGASRGLYGSARSGVAPEFVDEVAFADQDLVGVPGQCLALGPVAP